MIIKKLFGNERVCGIAGNKSSGKTNNLISLIVDFRKYNKVTPIYVFGVSETILKYLSERYEGIKEFNSISQLIEKRDCLIIIDEFQKLKLNDRRHKEALADFVDFIYHKNNKVILSSANLREFNSVIGGVIERWALKSVNSSNVINGSQLKNAILDYKGRYKSLSSITMPKSKLLVINDSEEIVLDLEYIAEVDDKKDLVDIFEIKEGEKKVKELSEELPKSKDIKFDNGSIIKNIKQEEKIRGKF